MITYIISHQVQDYATWQAGFLADEPRRTAAGVKSHIIGEVDGHPGMAIAILSCENGDFMEKTMQDPNLMEAMKAAGVLAPPSVQVLANANSGTY